MKTTEDIIKSHGTWQEDNDKNTVCCISLPELNKLASDLIEFANRFISVDEQLPEDNDNLTQTEKYIYTENPVLVLTANGKHAISKRSKFKQNKNSKWEWMGSSSFSDSVTHWRAI